MPRNRNSTRLTLLVTVVLVSLSAVSTLTSAERAPPNSRGTRWAILVAVGDYVQLTDLLYPEERIFPLRDQLVAAGFPREQVFVLHDSAQEQEYLPTKRNIESALQSVLDALAPGDTLLIVLSGHGSQLGTKWLFSAADHRVQPNHPAHISIDSILRRVESAPVAAALLIFDGCRYDDQAPDGRHEMAVNSNQRLLDSLEWPPARTLTLSSCAPGELAYLDFRLRTTVFLHYLTEGLKGPADSDHSGAITVWELWDYTSKRTNMHSTKLTGSRQRPKLKGNLADDFDVVVVAP